MRSRRIRFLTAALPAVLVLLPVAGAGQVPKASSDTSPVIHFDSRVVALKNVRVIDGTGTPPKEQQTLLIEAGKIRAIGNVADVVIPSGAAILDLAGSSVLPGLVMLHEHLHYGQPLEPSVPPRLYLAFGVTTLRTAGTGVPYVDLNVKRAIAEGRLHGPEIFVTSPFFNGEWSVPADWGDKVVRDAEDARRAVRYWAGEGVTSFKAYQRISKEALAAMIDEAHRLGLPVTAHIASVTCREAAELGIDNLEHGFGPCGRELVGAPVFERPAPTQARIDVMPDAPGAQALIRTLVNQRVTLTATPINRSRAMSERELELMRPEARERFLRGQRKPGPGGSWISEKSMAALTLAFVRAGGQLVLGTDPYSSGHLEGFGNPIALETLVTQGFTPLEAIRIATSNGARFLRIQDRIGSIAVGKEADLMVLRGNPSQRIEDIENVEMVFSNGVAYDPKVLLSAVKGLASWR